MKSEKIKKKIHYWTSDQKLKWFGYGEWIEEPDSLEIEYRGYKALVERISKQEPFAKEETYFGGHLCGYVVIPDDHPLFKKENIDIDCHFGITFNEAYEEHLIGFDCAHSGDYIPSMELIRKKCRLELYPIPKGYENFNIFNPTYRNVQYCIDECKKMIDQLIIEKETWEKNKQSKKKSTTS